MFGDRVFPTEDECLLTCTRLHTTVHSRLSAFIEADLSVL